MAKHSSDIVTSGSTTFFLVVFQSKTFVVYELMTKGHDPRPSCVPCASLLCTNSVTRILNHGDAHPETRYICSRVYLRLACLSL